MRDACLGLSDTVIAAEIITFQADRSAGISKHQALNQGTSNCTHSCEEAGGPHTDCRIYCGTCVAAIVDAVYP